MCLKYIWLWRFEEKDCFSRKLRKGLPFVNATVDKILHGGFNCAEKFGHVRSKPPALPWTRLQSIIGSDHLASDDRQIIVKSYMSGRRLWRGIQYGTPFVESCGRLCTALGPHVRRDRQSNRPLVRVEIADCSAIVDVQTYPPRQNRQRQLVCACGKSSSDDQICASLKTIRNATGRLDAA